MARRRHQNSDSTKRARDLQREKRAIENLRYLSRRGVQVDPTDYKAIARKARDVRARETLEKNYGHRVNAKERKLLAERGFYTTKKKVIIDGPRDAKRKRIPGARMRVAKDGTVSWTVKNRRDYVIGFTKKEKADFAKAKDQESFLRDMLKRARKKNPTLRKVRPSKIQTRIQWGAFQATKDFSAQHFAKSGSGQAFINNKAIPTNHKKARDVFVGVHFVVHLPQKRKSKRAANKKKGG